MAAFNLSPGAGSPQQTLKVIASRKEHTLVYQRPGLRTSSQAAGLRIADGANVGSQLWRKFVLTSLVVPLVLTYVDRTAWAQQEGNLRVGAAKVDITPAEITGLTNLWGTPLTGVHDKIFARALVLGDGGTLAAILTVDSVEVGDQATIIPRLSKETGIPQANITLAATHDHTSPMLSLGNASGSHRAGPAGVRFVAQVEDQLVAVLREAQKNLQPAAMATAQGAVDININRDERTDKGYILGRNPSGPSDKRVWVLRFETYSGEPIAYLVNYSVHGSVIGVNNHLLTGDLPGATSRFLEDYYGKNSVALWTSGAAGDQNPISMSADSNDPDIAKIRGNEDGSAQMYQVVDVLARLLGEEVVRVSEKTGAERSPVRLRASEKIVFCPGQTIVGSGTGNPLQKVQALDAPPVPFRLGLLMIGNVAITTVSAEVVTRIYGELLRQSPYADTVLITLANGRIGYVPDDASYDGWTQEAIGSPLKQGCGARTIVNGLLDLMKHY